MKRKNTKTWRKKQNWAKWKERGFQLIPYSCISINKNALVFIHSFRVVGRQLFSLFILIPVDKKNDVMYLSYIFSVFSRSQSITNTCIWNKFEIVSTSSRLQLPGNLSFTKQLLKLSGCVYLNGIHYFTNASISLHWEII